MVQSDHLYINYYKKEFLRKPIKGKKENDKRFWARKFEEFCKRTDLHGFKYIVMKDLNVIERLVILTFYYGHFLTLNTTMLVILLNI